MLELTRLGWGQENHAFMQVWASTFQPGGSLDYLRSWAEQMQLATAPETAVRLLEPIQEVGIHEQRLGLVKRLSMMRIIARRTKAATVLA